MKKTLNRIVFATFLVVLALAPTSLLSSKHKATADGMPGTKHPIVADGMPGTKQPGGGGLKPATSVIADGMPGTKQPGGLRPAMSVLS